MSLPDALTAAADLLSNARAAGLRVELDNGRLHVQGAGVLLAAWRERLRRHRAEIVTILAETVTTWSPAPTPPPDPRAALAEAYEERAAILEYDAGLSRADAEAAARRLVYGEPQSPEGISP